MSSKPFFFNSSGNSYLVLLLTLVFLHGIGISVTARSLDYDNQSPDSVDFVSLTLEMGIQPQNLKIDAAASYHIKAHKDSVKTLLFYAEDMEIISVSADGSEAGFALEKGQLTVSLPEFVKKGQEFDLRIRYSSNPHFGVLRGRHNTVWTSMLPKTQRHWVPSANYSDDSLKATFNISVPAEYHVWATGQKTEEEKINKSITRYHFKTERKVPASSLGFMIGKFKNNIANVSDTKVNLAVEEAISHQIDAQKLMQKTSGWLQQLETEMSVEFPYNSLDIIVLDDHHWETKSWEASTIYLYRNRGNFKAQLLRGLIGQWTSAKSLPYKWKQADAVSLYQTMILHSMVDFNAVLEIKDQPQADSTVYRLFGPARWNSWQQQWKDWKGYPDGFLSALPPNLIRQFVLSLSSEKYAGYWNESSIFELPEFNNNKDTTSTDQASADSVIYNVKYQFNQTDGSISLNFEALKGSYNEPMMLKLHKVYGNDSEVTSIDFSGAEDTIILSVSEGLQTAWISKPDNLKLKLQEKKPVSFLLYELRNAQSVNRRAKAARGLGSHTKNPDLQLAITDALNSDIEPEVRAGLLTSLAAITDGATGMQQIFLDALQSEHKMVQKAGLSALQYYSDQPGIQSKVENIVANTKSNALFGEGVVVLSKIASKDEFNAFLSNINRQDSTGQRILTAADYLAEQGISDSTVSALITPYLDAGYPYEIRQKAVKILLKHDTSPESWLARGKAALTESADPRIRYLIAKGMLKNSSPEINSFLSKYLSAESDLRVYQLIKNGLN